MVLLLALWGFRHNMLLANRLMASSGGKSVTSISFDQDSYYHHEPISFLTSIRVSSSGLVLVGSGTMEGWVPPSWADDQSGLPFSADLYEAMFTSEYEFPGFSGENIWNTWLSVDENPYLNFGAGGGSAQVFVRQKSNTANADDALFTASSPSFVLGG